ncbi:MAG: ABC transporter permease [Chitinophagaceae bacterium]
MLQNYFKTMLRNLWKNKTYGFLNILGLAIGIACTGLIFLWIEDEMTFDDVNLKKSMLYRVNINRTFDGRTYTMASTPRPMALALKEEIPGIVNAARISDQAEQALFSFNGKAMYAAGMYADSSLFSMFTFSFVAGDAKTAFQQLYSLVITEATAKKFFGEVKNAAGKTLQVDNKHNFIVTAVIKNLPPNSSLQFEWLAPYQVSIAHNPARWGTDDGLNWGSYGPLTYVELDEKANPVSISKNIKHFIRQKKMDEESLAILFSMNDFRLYDEFENGKKTGSGRIRQVHMLSAIGWIILFIACFNFMNLVTANSQQRFKEIGVRKMLGAGRKKLIIQFIGEALFISLISAMVAMLIIALALPAFNMLMQKQLALHVKNPLHISGLLIIALICGLLAGSYPSFYLSSLKPLYVLKGLKIPGDGAPLIRKGLVILQFTVSVVFIICTIIVYGQVQHIKNRELGFNKDNLVEVDLQRNGSKNFTAIKQDLLQSGFVENAAMSDHTTIYGGDTDDRFKWQGKPEGKEVSIAFRHVSPEFITVSGIKLAAGRDFNAGGAEDPTNIIINESMAKLMGNENIVGKIIQSPRDVEESVYINLKVVGVINDYVYGNVYGSPGPLLLLCKSGEDTHLLYLRLKPQFNAALALAKIEAIIKKHNPGYPVQYKFTDDQFNKMFFNETMVSKIAAVFAGLAIFISCLGLFGMATYTAGRRLKEIGIRKVLGAGITGLVSLLLKDFLQLVFIACLLAFPIAWWIMHGWLENYEYRTAISWWIFLASGLGAVLIALITISFKP